MYMHYFHMSHAHISIIQMLSDFFVLDYLNFILLQCPLLFHFFMSLHLYFVSILLYLFSYISLSLFSILTLLPICITCIELIHLIYYIRNQSLIWYVLTYIYKMIQCIFTHYRDGIPISLEYIVLRIRKIYHLYIFSCIHSLNHHYSRFYEIIFYFSLITIILRNICFCVHFLIWIYILLSYIPIQHMFGYNPLFLSLIFHSIQLVFTFLIPIVLIFLIVIYSIINILFLFIHTDSLIYILLLILLLL